MTAGGRPLAAVGDAATPDPASILVFTGKGGVGKTTVAAATALRCAAAGARTLVLSADPAHSLGDVLGERINPEPTAVAPDLWAQQLDARCRLESSWEVVRAWLVEMFRWAGASGLEAEELAVLPGLDEVFALTDIRRHATSGDFDVVVVDCGPSAETVRLLSLPNVLSSYMERLFPVGRAVNRAVAPVLGRLTDIPVAGEAVLDGVAGLHRDLGAVHELLSDPDVTRIRLVVNAESVVIAESRRTHTYLSLFGYTPDAVIVNRVLDRDLDVGGLAEWRTRQHDVVESLAALFGPLPILPCGFDPRELVGTAVVGELGATLWSGHDPLDRLSHADPLDVTVLGDHARLRMTLPFVERGDLSAARRGDDLVVSVGPHRRHLALPASLVSREVTGAKLDGAVLTVRFGAPGSLAEPTAMAAR